MPYGTEVIYDADATIEMCAATDAVFTRCVFTGVYAGDLGLVDRDIAKTLRLRKALGRNDLKMIYFVNSEGDVPGRRTYRAEYLCENCNHSR